MTSSEIKNKDKDKKYQDKKYKKKLKYINSSNCIRNISDTINTNTNFFNLKGNLYFNIHNIIIFFVIFIVIFNNSLLHLIITLIIVSFDALSIVVLHECPLTTLEKKYLGISSCDMRNIILKNMKITYNCDHDYEKQIELLINVWTIIASKCLLIMFFNSFNIKLFNFNHLYQN